MEAFIRPPAPAMMGSCGRPAGREGGRHRPWVAQHELCALATHRSDSRPRVGTRIAFPRPTDCPACSTMNDKRSQGGWGHSCRCWYRSGRTAVAALLRLLRRSPTAQVEGRGMIMRVE